MAESSKIFFLPDILVSQIRSEKEGQMNMLNSLCNHKQSPVILPVAMAINF